MRLHTNTLTERDIYEAVADMDNVFVQVTRHGSRQRDHAFEVYLTGNSPHRPNRAFDSDEHAATWDEWGLFLARLFRIDPTMTSRYYADEAEFNYRTGWRFTDEHTLVMHRKHKWEFVGMPGENYCECGAVRRWAA